MGSTHCRLSVRVVGVTGRPGPPVRSASSGRRSASRSHFQRSVWGPVCSPDFCGRSLTAAGQTGNTSSTVQGDAGNLEDPGRLFAQVKAEKGGPDILVVSAGLVEMALMAAIGPGAFQQTLRHRRARHGGEMKDRAIRVNTRSPAAIDTQSIDGPFKGEAEADGARAMFAQMTPLGRIGRPEEMASAHERRTPEVRHDLVRPHHR